MNRGDGRLLDHKSTLQVTGGKLRVQFPCQIKPKTLKFMFTVILLGVQYQKDSEKEFLHKVVKLR